jgi:hypothetical protein
MHYITKKPKLTETQAYGNKAYGNKAYGNQSLRKPKLTETLYQIELVLIEYSKWVYQKPIAWFDALYYQETQAYGNQSFMSRIKGSGY